WKEANTMSGIPSALRSTTAGVPPTFIDRGSVGGVHDQPTVPKTGPGGTCDPEGGRESRTLFPSLDSATTPSLSTNAYRKSPAKATVPETLAVTAAEAPAARPGCVAEPSSVSVSAS